MEISRNATTAKGPAETFTGDVWVDPITRGLPPSQLNVAAVRFTPGARSAWHSHDGGKPCTSPMAAAWSRCAGSRPSNSNPATSSTHPTAKNTGTAPRPTTS
jgi:hypothetical protein